MGQGDTGDTGDSFVELGIVLHGAGAQRVHAQIDVVVPGGESREVANDFHFADLGKSPDLRPQIFGVQDLLYRDILNVQPGKGIGGFTGS
jgi:hypothetical protein